MGKQSKAPDGGDSGGAEVPLLCCQDGADADCSHTAIDHDGHVGYLYDGRLLCSIGDDYHVHVLPYEAPKKGGFTAENLDPGHIHRPGCGHDRVPHGNHYDYLVGDRLHHVHDTDCPEEECCTDHIEDQDHGRLLVIKHGAGSDSSECRGYGCGHNQGAPTFKQKHSAHGHGAAAAPQAVDPIALVLGTAAAPAAAAEDPSIQSLEAAIASTKIFCSGICCPSEIPIIHKVLGNVPGISKVAVDVTSRTVMVDYNPAVTVPGVFVASLNEARLGASLSDGAGRDAMRPHPLPWSVRLSGLFLAISILSYAGGALEHLKWVALAGVAVGIPPILLKSWAAIKHRILDINTLMVIAVAGAIAIAEYLEAGAVVFLFAISEWLESRSVSKAREAMAAVLSLRPSTAVLAETGEEVAVDMVPVGSVVAVKPGQSIPIDGEVVSGASSIDEAILTGESRPVAKGPGASVSAGTINLLSYLEVRTTAISADSAVARMVRLVEEAQSQRSATEQLVQNFAKYYTPAVVLAAGLLALLPFALGFGNYEYYLHLSLVLLVISCPCALVISTPITYVSGLAQAARDGVLIKGGAHLETLGHVTNIAFDKTGTLTEGVFRVNEMRPLGPGVTEKQLLAWMAAVESQAIHPLAAAITAHAATRGVKFSKDVKNFEILPGEGATAEVQGHRVHVGNDRMARKRGWINGHNSSSSLAPLAEMAAWEEEGATVGWVGVDNVVIGVYACSDTVRAESAEALATLKGLGVKVCMITGDNAGSAAKVASHVGIAPEDTLSDLTPEDKLAAIKSLAGRSKKDTVAMVGDGVNDAPALAAAGLGVAMGVAGTAVAMETADVALFSNDLRRLARAVILGRRAVSKIRQNVAFSFLIKLATVLLGVLWSPSLWIAIIADVGASLLVIFNGMSILDTKAAMDDLLQGEEDGLCKLKAREKRSTAANILSKAKDLVTDAFASRGHGHSHGGESGGGHDHADVVVVVAE